MARARSLLITVLALLGVTGAATARADALPVAADGHPVRLVASGMGVITSFAFGDGSTFVGDAGAADYSRRGGIYVIDRGVARLLTQSPRFVTGLAWRRNTLYSSGRYGIIAWSGWNGTRFARRRWVWRAPSDFAGLDGVAFAPDGRLWSGVESYRDHGPERTAYGRDILSFGTRGGRGGRVRVVARGIRQPWQIAFPRGSSRPYVTDMGQDSGAVNPPDAILRVTAGDDYGFPTCNWLSASACGRYAKPFQLLPAHSDAMGVAIVGSRLYLSEYGSAHPAAVVSIPLRGGPPAPLLSGFADQIVGLGAHGGTLYVGETDGKVFAVRP